MSETLPELLDTARSLTDRLRQLGDAVAGAAEAAGAGAAQAPAAARFITSVAQMNQRAEQFLAHLQDPARLDLRDRACRHDLRAHLALIIGYAELWQRSADRIGMAAHVEALAGIVSNARRALALLEAVATAMPQPPVGAIPAPTNGGRERGELLVVDDRPENRELLRTLLEQQGHSVTVAASGQEALTLLAGRSFDLILLDVMMPEMDGFAVLDRLKREEAWRHIPVVMVSALDRLDSVVEGIARGAEDYLTRPFNQPLLRARIGACLEKKRLRDREMEHLARIDQLLHAIFPAPELVDELKQNQTIRPRRHDKVGVCFVDVVDFTTYCDRHAGQPELVVRNLEWYVNVFETTAQKHGVKKIKTIGDAFLMVSGLFRPADNPVLQLVRCATELLEAIRSGPAGWQVRIGVHVGPVVAGTLGESQYSFDLWGSTVNIAARMESGGRPGKITLSDKAWADIAGVCEGSPHEMAVRGLRLMTVWEFEGFR